MSRMTKLLSMSLLVALLAAACGTDVNKASPAPDKKETPPVVSPVSQVVDVEATVRDAKCGCSIESVGHCGNYVMIEGKYVPLIHASLGKMQFCKQKDAGAKIEVSGAMKDGKYIATNWKLVE